MPGDGEYRGSATMTLAEFRDTRQWSDDLGTALDNEALTMRPRWLYGPRRLLYIEKRPPFLYPRTGIPQRLFSLVIGNTKTVGDDLAALEKQLYDWALDEGCFD